jgi:hypothetical protein
MARIFLNRAANRTNVVAVRLALMAGTLMLVIAGVLVMSGIAPIRP